MLLKIQTYYCFIDIPNNKQLPLKFWEGSKKTKFHNKKHSLPYIAFYYFIFFNFILFLNFT